MKKILISGVGSLLGQGLIKTINLSKKNFIVYGTDYLKDAIGLYWVKKGYILPDILKNKKKEKLWLNKIIKIIEENKIDYVIPGLDFELPLFSKFKEKIEMKCSCKVIVSDLKIINVFRDKWKTVEFLKKNNFFYPSSVLPSKLNTFLKKNKFPLIVKPRIGSTSKNVFLTKNKKELIKAIKNCKNPIIQEYLYKKNNEYTCGVIYNDKTNKIVSRITLNRKLKNGNTVSASLKKNIKFNLINNFISKVTQKIKPTGPINFQLCLVNNKPYIFEVNPRFSGSTPLRAIFGLNEIELLFNSIEGGGNKEKNLKYGNIMRYFTDFYFKKEIRFE